MKKVLSVLLVLTMVLAFASTAMAATNYTAGDMIVLKRDANAYDAAKSSKKTKSVAAEGSTALVVKQCGDYVQVVVNWGGTTTYFRKCDVTLYYGTKGISVIWNKGGKGMSTCIKDSIIDFMPQMTKVKVTGHTNLRKNPGMKFKSQGVVEKGDVLKYKGYIGIDDRLLVPWFKVRYKGKNLWISGAYCTEPYCAK
jgi:hypothetical protein